MHQSPFIHYAVHGFGVRRHTRIRPRLAGEWLPSTVSAAMLRIRIIEEEIEKRYHQDQMKTPIHLVIGQEATSVGAAPRCGSTTLPIAVIAPTATTSPRAAI